MNDISGANFHLQQATQPKAALPKIQSSASKIREASEGFAAVFLSQMVEKMFESVNEDSFYGNSNGQDIFRSMATQEYAVSLSKTSPLSDQIEQSLRRYQEVI